MGPTESVSVTFLYFIITILAHLCCKISVDHITVSQFFPSSIDNWLVCPWWQSALVLSYKMHAPCWAGSWETGYLPDQDLRMTPLWTKCQFHVRQAYSCLLQTWCTFQFVTSWYASMVVMLPTELYLMRLYGNINNVNKHPLYFCSLVHTTHIFPVLSHKLSTNSLKLLLLHLCIGIGIK